MDAPKTADVAFANQALEDPPNPIRKRTNSWEQTHAIVYDVSSQTLTKEKRRNVGGAHHTRIEIPKRPKSPLRKDNVRISISLCPGSEAEFLAEIKLSSLGFKVAFERFLGNIDEIWIKGVPRAVY